MKVACLCTRFYKFRQRLKYKCSLTETKFKLVDKFYTSKTCSLCGSYKKNLEGNKIYNCINCKKTIDTVINFFCMNHIKNMFLMYKICQLT